MSLNNHQIDDFYYLKLITGQRFSLISNGFVDICAPVRNVISLGNISSALLTAECRLLSFSYLFPYLCSSIPLIRRQSFDLIRFPIKFVSFSKMKAFSFIVLIYVFISFQTVVSAHSPSESPSPEAETLSFDKSLNLRNILNNNYESSTPLFFISKNHIEITLFNKDNETACFLDV